MYPFFCEQTKKKKQTKTMKKTYILDTNILLDDPNAVTSFDEHDIVIPLIVVEEIDRFKDKNGSLGANARSFARFVNEFVLAGEDLRAGVELPGGGTLRVLSIEDAKKLNRGQVEVVLPEELQEFDGGDNKILKVVSALRKQFENNDLDNEPILVTRDIQLRVKSNALGLPSEDRRKRGIKESVSKLYRGQRLVSGVDEQIAKLYTKKETGIDVGSIVRAMHGNDETFEEIKPNEFVQVRDGKGEVVSTYRRNALRKRFDKVQKRGLKNLNVKNEEQNMALDLLLDPDVSLVSIIGLAGAGKTLITLAAGLEQVLEKNQYQQLVICRPIQPLGQDIGYLPGSKSEKLEPWIAPIKDNLKFLLRDKSKKKTFKDYEESKKFNVVNELFEQGIIEAEAITYLRGRSIANAFIIIDEAQNLTEHEMKTILTRAGEGSKIVLTGDVEQIDNLYVDGTSNGLAVAVEAFKDCPFAGHITLVKGERSKLASYAAEVL